MYVEIRDRRTILVLCSLSFLVGYFIRLTWAILSSFSTLHPTVGDNSLIFSMFFAGYFVSQIPAGFLADKIPAKRIVAVALLGLAASAVLSGTAWTIMVEILASLMTGLAAGWIYPSTVKILTSCFRSNELSVAIGYYSLAWPSAIILTGIMLPTAASTLGWRAPYYVLALVCLTLAILIVFTRESNVHAENFDFSIIKQKNVILLSAAGFLFFLAYWLLALYSYSYLLTIGLSSVNAGLIYSALAVAGIPSTMLSGYIMRRLGVQSTLALSVLIYAALLLPFSFVVNMYTLFFIATLIGFFRFIITPAGTTLASLVGGPEKAGSVNGITNFFGQASGTIGPLAASLIIRTAGYSVLWLLSFALSIIAAIMYWLVRIG